VSAEFELFATDTWTSLRATYDPAGFTEAKRQAFLEWVRSEEGSEELRKARNPYQVLVAKAFKLARPPVRRSTIRGAL